MIKCVLPVYITVMVDWASKTNKQKTHTRSSLSLSLSVSLSLSLNEELNRFVDNDKHGWKKRFFWRLWPQQRESYTCKDRLGTVTPLSGIDNRIIVAIISSSIGPVLHVTLFHLRLPRTESTLGTSKPKHRQQQNPKLF